MRSILIGILLGKGHRDLYMKNFEHLRDHYLRVINRYNIPADVIGYVGEPGTETWYDPESHILHCDTPDLCIAAKRRIFHDIGKYYGVLLPTNASTVVNIRLLNEFIQSEGFREDYIYGISTTYDFRIEDRHIFEFFQGMFTIYSTHVVDLIEPYWEEARRFIFESNNQITEGTPEDPYMYVSDDMVISYACHLAGVRNHPLLQEYEMYLYMHNDVKWTRTISEVTDIKDLAGSTAVICKSQGAGLTATDEEDEVRVWYEPTIVGLICAIYEGLEIGKDIVDGFITMNSDYELNHRPRIICNSIPR